MKNKLEHEMLDAMHRDLGNWRGPFYVNRKDPRVLVPKYNQMMGMTINFGNPYAWVALVGIILIIVIISFI